MLSERNVRFSLKKHKPKAVKSNSIRTEEFLLLWLFMRLR